MRPCVLALPVLLLVGCVDPGPPAPDSRGEAVAAGTWSWAAYGEQEGAHLDVNPGATGDVDGDGYADLVTIALLGDLLAENDGFARLYLGGPDGLGASPVWIGTTGQAASPLSRAEFVGDLDGDGLDEIALASATYDTTSFTGAGRVEVYLGTASGALGATPWWSMEGGSDDEFFGQSVAGLGDFDGDGLGDLAIGCSNCDAPELDEGTASVFFGDPAGLSGAPDWGPIGCDQDGARCGDVHGAGDVDGDGAGDLLVLGAGWNTTLHADAGSAFHYLGSPDPAVAPATTPAWSAFGANETAAIGGGASGGDADGDGYSDVVVTWRADDDAGDGYGQVRLYPGGPSGPALFPAWTLEGDQAGAMELASLRGDLDGDGLSDLVVGFEGYWSPGGDGAGRARVYRGDPDTYLGSVQVWSRDGSDTGDALGSGMLLTADTDGDGRGEIAVAGRFWDFSEDDEGAVFVHAAAGDPSSTVAAEVLGGQTSAWLGGSVTPPPTSTPTATTTSSSGPARTAAPSPTRAGSSSTSAAPAAPTPPPRGPLPAGRPTPSSAPRRRPPTSTATAGSTSPSAPPSSTTASRTRGSSRSGTAARAASRPRACPTSASPRTTRSPRWGRRSRPGTSTATGSPTSSRGPPPSPPARPTRAPPSCTGAPPRA